MTQSNSPKRLQEWLGSSLLGEVLLPKAQDLVQIQEIVQKAIDADLGQHCQVVQWQRGVLILSVSSPAWATRLRYALNDLRDALRMTLPNLVNIKVLISPESVAPLPEVAPREPQFSQRAVAPLREAADGVGHEKLKQAMQLLAEKLSN